MHVIEGKVAMVTGGASGIGTGIVAALLEEGAVVAICDVNEAHLAEMRARFEGANGVGFFRANVALRESLQAAADEVLRQFGRIDILCNNAGVPGGGAVDDPSFDAWDRAMRINLGGVVNGCKIVVPMIRAGGAGGHIVNTASMAGITALPDEGGCYTTAKFAVRGLTESLRLTLAPHGIGVSCLCPGLTRSRIMEAPDDGAKPLAREGDPDALFNSMAGAMEPIEVGRAVVRGIRDNAPWILPHGEFREEIEELNAALVAAFPRDQAIPPERLAFEEGRRRMSDARRAMPVA